MPLKTFRCSICGKGAPRDLLEEGGFKDRMKWLWKHRKENHPKAHERSTKKSLKTRKKHSKR